MSENSLEAPQKLPVAEKPQSIPKSEGDNKLPFSKVLESAKRLTLPPIERPETESEAGLTPGITTLTTSDGKVTVNLVEAVYDPEKGFVVDGVPVMSKMQLLHDLTALSQLDLPPGSTVYLDYSVPEKPVWKLRSEEPDGPKEKRHGRNWQRRFSGVLSGFTNVEVDDLDTRSITIENDHISVINGDREMAFQFSGAQIVEKQLIDPQTNRPIPDYSLEQLKLDVAGLSQVEFFPKSMQIEFHFNGKSWDVINKTSKKLLIEDVKFVGKKVSGIFHGSMSHDLKFTFEESVLKKEIEPVKPLSPTEEKTS